MGCVEALRVHECVLMPTHINKENGEDEYI